MWFVILVLLIVLLFGGGGYGFYAGGPYALGYGGVSLGAVLLILLIVLLATGRL